MATEALMITKAEIFEIALNNENLDPDLITDKVILKTQRKYIKSKLATETDTVFYDALVASIDNSSIAGDHLTLWDDYIKNAMAYYVVYEILPDIHMQIGNNGIRTNTEEFSTEITDSQFGIFRGKKRDDAEWYMQEMLVYLKNNKDLYPDYPNCDTDRPRSTKFVIY